MLFIRMRNLVAYFKTKNLLIHNISSRYLYMQNKHYRFPLNLRAIWGS